MANTIRSKAGHVLATSDDADARSVASYVLSGGLPIVKASRDADELRRLLSKIDGVEGQSERADEIRKQLNVLEQQE